jgi:hypothetical protein
MKETAERGMKFEIFMASNVTITVFCDVMPCTLVDLNVSEGPAALIFRVEVLLRRLRHQVAVECYYPSSIPDGVTYQKAAMLKKGKNKRTTVMMNDVMVASL